MEHGGAYASAIFGTIASAMLTWGLKGLHCGIDALHKIPFALILIFLHDCMLIQ